MTGRRWTTGGGGLVAVAAVLAVAAVSPEPVVVGAARLAAIALAVSGAALLVSRAGALDLATAAAVAVGAYAGGVGTALLALPVFVGLPLGAVAGAAVGALSGALHGRVGRTLGALTSLAIGLAVLAAIGTWRDGGGVAGFHAVGLPTPWGDRTDLVAVGVALLLGLAGAQRLATSHTAAAASIGVRSPVVAASLGRRPWRDGATFGAGAGALLGSGGTVLAAVDGSVLPGAYGLEMAAGLALAAALGGSRPLGALVGTVFVWGPGTVWPLVPLVGTAPPLLVMGPLGLLVLGWRRGRPLVADVPSPAGPGPDEGEGPLRPVRRCSLDVRAAQTPSGPIDLHVQPGEVVALVGPNGGGKSTLLARIAGQLPDHRTVRFGDDPAGPGPVARAGAGLARTWQRPPRLPTMDAQAVVVDGRPERAAAARWATATLGGSSPDDPGTAQLVRLAASGPAVALLDEPTDVEPDRLLALLRGLAAVGTAVVVVDHRPEVAAGADRVVSLGAEPGAEPGEVGP